MVFIKFLAIGRKWRKIGFILHVYLQSNIERAERFEFNFNFFTTKVRTRLMLINYLKRNLSYTGNIIFVFWVAYISLLTFSYILLLFMTCDMEESFHISFKTLNFVGKDKY